MNFFAQELKKIVGATHPDATYAGRACFVRLSETNRARLEFVTLGYADKYEALKVTVLNRTDGPVDSLILRLGDLLGKRQVSNPNFRDGIIPYIWGDGARTDWYVYQPGAADYKTLGAAADEYLEVFQEPRQAQTAQPGMGQQMY